MIIKLFPQRPAKDVTLELSKKGDVLTINGEDFDFGPLPDGATLPAGATGSPWFTDFIERVDGEIVLTVILPIPVNYSPEQAFPKDIVSPPDGPIALPQPLPPVELALEDYPETPEPASGPDPADGHPASEPEEQPE